MLRPGASSVKHYPTICKWPGMYKGKHHIIEPIADDLKLLYQLIELSTRNVLFWLNNSFLI